MLYYNLLEGEIMELLQGLLVQLTLLFVLIIGLGYILDILVKGYQYLFFRYQVLIIYCGYLGIVVHESFHLLIAKLFGYQIESVVFVERTQNTIQGNVRYSRKIGSKIQEVGTLFVAMAPFIGGLFLLGAGLYFINPTFYKTFMIYEQYDADISYLPIVLDTIRHLLSSVFTLFSINELSIKLLIYVVLGVPIALYSSMSSQDIKTSAPSMKYLLPIFVIGNVFIYLFLRKYYGEFVLEIVSLVYIFIRVFAILVFMILLLFVLSGIYALLVLGIKKLVIWFKN